MEPGAYGGSVARGGGWARPVWDAPGASCHASPLPDTVGGTPLTYGWRQGPLLLEEARRAPEVRDELLLAAEQELQQLRGGGARSLIVLVHHAAR